MEMLKNNVRAARKWAALKLGIKKDSLRMDILLQFGALALVLWIIVENSPAASTAFAAILTAGRNAITGLLGNIGSL